MRNKSIIKSVLAIVLVIASLFTLFGCKKNEGEKLQYIDGNLPNQITNQRFYFQQGYLDTWEVTQQGSDDYAINEDTGLALVLEPTADKGKVQYAIYAHTDATILMTDSAATVMAQVMNEDSDDFAFNKHNYIDGERTAFVPAESYEPFTCKHSKLQMYKVSYDFTKDGADWKGIYYYSYSKAGTYFIVTFECEASLFDKYAADLEETIGDFRKEGWETEKK